MRRRCLCHTLVQGAVFTTWLRSRHEIHAPPTPRGPIATEDGAHSNAEVLRKATGPLSPRQGERPAPPASSEQQGEARSVRGAHTQGREALSEGLHRHLNSDYRQFRARQHQEDQRRLRQARRPSRPEEPSGGSNHTAEAHFPQPARSPRPSRATRQTTQFADDEAFWGHEADDGATAPVPMVHPGTTGLPPLRQPTRKPKFSFVAHTTEKPEKDFYAHSGVPNNTPKPLLPMWASSLTSPALGKQRLTQENWISSDSLGYVSAGRTRRFLSWLTGTAEEAEKEKTSTEQAASWAVEAESNVELLLRKHQCRGVYAKRTFAKDEVIFRIPLFRVDQPTSPAASDSAPAWARTLNAEVLATCSSAAQGRAVPSYTAIKEVLSVQRSSFDPIPHPLFIDQMHFAMLLACERADGAASPLAPYFALFNDSDDASDLESGKRPLLDDDHIQDLYRGVLEPSTHLEYRDHINRFSHYARELHKLWWGTYTASDGAEAASPEHTEGKGLQILKAPPLRSAEAADGLAPVPSEKTERYNSTSDATAGDALSSASSDATTQGEHRRSRRPPPPIEDLEWAMRFVLSRQRVLPLVRVHADAVMAAEAEQEGWEKRELDWFARAVVKAKLAFYDHVFGAVDRDKIHVNAFDVHSAPTVVPLFDLLQHPPNGVANTVYAVEENSMTPPASTASSGDVRHDSSEDPQRWLVVRAAEDIDASDELTVLFQRGYSVSYSLFRYGFLPLRQREDDMRDFMVQHGLSGERKLVSPTTTKT